MPLMPSDRFFVKANPMLLRDVSAFFDANGGVFVQGKKRQANLDTPINGVASLDAAIESDVTLLHNARYVAKLSESKALVCITNKSFVTEGLPDIPCIFHPQPYRAFAQLATHMFVKKEMPNDGMISTTQGAWVHPTATIHQSATLSPGAVIGADVEIGERTEIGANTVIAQGVTIGNDCRIEAHTSLQFCELGDNISLSTGVRIGQAGFGFVMDEKGHVPVPQLGRVLIENNVDIGATTTIDRGTLNDTIIGAGTRIDNLVQIGHGVQLGKGCVIVAQVGIAGSTILEDHVIVAGQVGIAGHIRIGKGARIAAKSGVMKDVAPGQTMAGMPAVPVTKWHRQNVTLARLAASKS